MSGSLVYVCEVPGNLYRSVWVTGGEVTVVTTSSETGHVVGEIVIAGRVVFEATDRVKVLSCLSGVDTVETVELVVDPVVDEGLKLLITPKGEVIVYRGEVRLDG